MAGNLQPLDQKFPIAKPDGTPTDYFIKWAQQRQIDITDGITAEQAVELIQQWAAERNIIAGIDLDGGGSLDADVTIDHADSGVVADTYGDATHVAQITVNDRGHVTDVTEVAISGGGGGGYPYEIPPTMPSAADFTLQNDGGVATLVDTTYGMLLSTPAAGAQIRFARYTAAALPSTFVMTMRAQGINPFANSSYNCCLIARNSANGRIIIAGEYQYYQTLIQAWSSYSGFAGNQFGPSGKDRSQHWHQMELTATQLIFRFSPNGQDWFTYHTENLAGYIVAVDEAGLGIMTNGDITATIFQSFEIV